MLNGADYVAIKRVSDVRNKTLAMPGETCERVPASALDWLLKQDHIRRKPDVERRAPTPPPAAADKPTPRRRQGEG